MNARRIRKDRQEKRAKTLRGQEQSISDETQSLGPTRGGGTMRGTHSQIEQLYEISKLLTNYDRIEGTLPKVLALMSEVVPLRLAILLLEVRTTMARSARTRTRSILWHADGVSVSRLRAARAHAYRAYGELTRSAPRIQEEESGPTLPSSGPVPPESDKDGFVLLPLVVDHHRIFGALLIEGVSRLDETSVAFVNAIINQLAIALDRAAGIVAQREVADAAKASADILADVSAAIFSSLSYEKTLDAVAHAAIPRLADMAFIDRMHADGRVDRAMAINERKTSADLVRLFSPAIDPGSPQARVLDSGESILVENIETGRALPAASMIVVPLRTHGTGGALTLVTLERGQPYTADDLALAEEIGRRGGIAIDNAELYEQAKRAVHARQELIAVVSHDLKNPIGSILISTTLLLKTPSDDLASQSKRVEVIQRSAHRMNRLIADLLDVTTIEAGHLSVEKKRHPAASIMRDTIEAHAAMAEQKSIRLEGAFPDEPCAVDCDRDRLLQILGNLIGNALKFTPAGGTITVRAAPRPEDTLFSVSDTGPGIAPEDLPHIFDRYWRATKTARLGTGLGLSIAKGLVEAHGGRIWTGPESTLGHGATFSFTIPVDEDAAHAQRDRSSGPDLEEINLKLKHP